MARSVTVEGLDGEAVRTEPGSEMRPESRPTCGDVLTRVDTGRGIQRRGPSVNVRRRPCAPSRQVGPALRESCPVGGEPRDKRIEADSDSDERRDPLLLKFGTTLASCGRTNVPAL